MDLVTILGSYASHSPQCLAGIIQGAIPKLKAYQSVA